MELNTLNLLECPFCGGSFRIERNRFGGGSEQTITSGILLCECCAYPIVQGIPYLRTGSQAQRAMELLGKGQHDGAFALLLGLPEGDQKTVTHLCVESTTFREALQLLDHSAESQYLLYRFSDPTFIACEAVLLALGQNYRAGAKHTLDIGGGAGHLTRSLCQLERRGEVVLADLSFWKLYLAKRFIAPECHPVCCNANDPLPFAIGHFSFVACSDAFHYIWSKRSLAGEMQRLAGRDGIITLPHLHNAACWNPSQGMPLSVGGYARLFPGYDIRVFAEDPILKDVLDNGTVNLSGKGRALDGYDADAAVTLIASADDVFEDYKLPPPNSPEGMSINPLFRQDGQTWRRGFPTSDYEEEYGRCKDYLPEHFDLRTDQLDALHRGEWDDDLRELARRRALLPLPKSYV